MDLTQSKLDIYAFPKEWQDWFDRLSDREKIISKARRSVLDSIIDPKEWIFTWSSEQWWNTLYSINTKLDENPTTREKQMHSMLYHWGSPNIFYQSPQNFKRNSSEIKRKEEEKRNMIEKSTIKIFNTLLALQKDLAISKIDKQLIIELSKTTIGEFITQFNRKRSRENMCDYLEEIGAQEVDQFDDDIINRREEIIIRVGNKKISVIENLKTYDKQRIFDWEVEKDLNPDEGPISNYYIIPKSTLAQPTPMLT